MTGPIDLFFRCASKGDIRDAIARACLFRWLDDPLVRVRLIRMSGIAMRRFPVSPEVYLEESDFHFTSRFYADQNAETDPYILVDDDQMPLGEKWVENALRAWHLYNANKKYVMMVSRSGMRAEDVTQHHPRLRDSKEEVEEMPYWWGSPYLSYKGAVPYGEFQGRADQQDPIVQDWARRTGKMQGLMMNVYYNHFGLSFSQVQPALWGRF